jgi:hypothetical protein
MHEERNMIDRLRSLDEARVATRRMLRGCALGGVLLFFLYVATAGVAPEQDAAERRPVPHLAASTTDSQEDTMDNDKEQEHIGPDEQPAGADDAVQDHAAEVQAARQQAAKEFDGLEDKKPDELTPDELRLMADTMPGEGPGD